MKHLMRSGGLALLASILPTILLAAELPPEADKVQRQMIEDSKDFGGCPGPQAVDHVVFGGHDTVVIDAQKMECGGVSGSAGAPLVILTETSPGRYTKVYGGYAQGWRMRGRTLVIGVHGTDCDRDFVAGRRQEPRFVGATGCEYRITWPRSGTYFVEISGRWRPVQ